MDFSLNWTFDYIPPTSSEKEEIFFPLTEENESYPSMEVITQESVSNVPRVSPEDIQQLQKIPQFKAIEITTREIINRAKLRIENNLKNYSSNKQKQLNQLNEEYSLLNELMTCEMSILNSFRLSASTLDSEKLGNYSSTLFYNPEMMRVILCLIQSLFQPDDNLNLSFRNRVHYWLHKLTQIGAASDEGRAFSAQFSSNGALESKMPKLRSGNNNSKEEMEEMEEVDGIFNKILVLKASNNTSAEVDNLVHELFVGLLLNELRSEIPNFVYVYSGIRCSDPIVDMNKKVLSWCSVANPTIQYLLMENVYPSISMADYIETCTPLQWLDKYLQILLSINYAHKKFSFTHFDLHSDNVLIRFLDDSNNEEFYILYPGNDNGPKIPIKTEAIATIIDYGFSYIEYTGKSYGRYNTIAYSDRSYPLYDAYRLLMTSMASMLWYQRNDIFQLASRVVKFFNTLEDPSKMVYEQNEYLYSLPYVERIRDLSIEDLMNFIWLSIPESREITSYPSSLDNVRILGCQGTDICLSSDQILQDLQFDPKSKKRSPVELFDYVSSQSLQIPNLDFPEFDPKTVSLMLQNEMSRLDNQLYDIYLDLDSIYKNWDQITDYQLKIEKICQFYDLYQDIKFNLQLLQYVFQLFPDQQEQDQDVLSEYQESLNRYYPVFNSLYQKLSQDFQSLTIEYSSYIVNNERDESEQFWYFETIPTVLDLIIEP